MADFMLAYEAVMAAMLAARSSLASTDRDASCCSAAASAVSQHTAIIIANLDILLSRTCLLRMAV
jgi:hypothetical protein